MTQIDKLSAWEILDSRGRPTVKGPRQLHIYLIQSRELSLRTGTCRRSNVAKPHIKSSEPSLTPTCARELLPLKPVPNNERKTSSAGGPKSLGSCLSHEEVEDRRNPEDQGHVSLTWVSRFASRAMTQRPSEFLRKIVRT